MATLTVGSGKDYSTIEAALAAADASDTIAIDAGTYTEYHLDFYDANLTIKAAVETVGSPNENTVILDGEGSTSKEYAFWAYASGTTYQHLTMKNFEEYGVRAGNIAGRSMTLSGCLIYGCDGPAVSALGFNSTTPAEIKDSIIIVDEGRAVNVNGNSPIHIYNSVLAVQQEDEAVVVSSISYPNVTASHCTFIGIGYISGPSSDGRHYHLINQVAKVNNCILYGGRGSGIGANSHDHNLVYLHDPASAGTGNAYVQFTADSWDGAEDSAGTGDLTGDPKFVTAPTLGSITPFNMDLNLQASSPAVDAGSSTFTADISGSARDSNPDMGAYERVTGVVVTPGYGNIIMTVAAGSLGKVLGVTRANASKVLGT